MKSCRGIIVTGRRLPLFTEVLCPSTSVFLSSNIEFTYRTVWVCVQMSNIDLEINNKNITITFVYGLILWRNRTVAGIRRLGNNCLLCILFFYLCTRIQIMQWWIWFSIWKIKTKLIREKQIKRFTVYAHQFFWQFFFAFGKKLLRIWGNDLSHVPFWCDF